MTTEAAPAAGTAAPAAPAPEAITPAPVTPPAPANDKSNPAWLPDRLAQHERALLKELGFSSKEEATAAAKLKADAEAAKKTHEEKLRDAESALSTERARLQEYEQTIAARAAREMASLSEERQKAVKALAGENAAKQLSIIDAFAPTWGAAPTATATTTIAAPANSAPPAGGPPPPPATPQPNHLATYESLLKSNPVKAANYYLQHQGAIHAARKTS